MDIFSFRNFTGSPDRGRIRADEGFTLIELSIIVIILGVILTVAVINYANAQRGIVLKGAQRQVEAALSRAMNAARQENVRYRMVFYPYTHASHPNTYEFLHDVENAGNWSLQPVDRSVSGEEVEEEGGHYYIRVANGVRIESESAITVDFDPLGTEMHITPATITLGLSGSQVQVALDSEGRITTQ